MRTSRWHVSIAVQIWVMVVTCLGIIAALIVVNSRAAVQHDKLVASEDLYKRGQAQANALSESFNQNSPMPAFAQLAAGEAIRSLGTPCNTALQSLSKGVADGYLEVIDAHGRVLCSSTKSHLSYRAPFASATYLRSRIASGQPGFDAPLHDPYGGDLSLWVEVPVNVTHGGPVGLIFVGSTQTSLTLDPTADRNIASTVIDDRTNTVLMHSPALPGAVGQTVKRRDLLTAFSATGPTTAVGVDGVRRLYREAPVEGTHLKLLIGMSTQQAYAEAQQSLRRNVIFGGVLILVVGLLGFLLHRRISRPARRLRRAIDHVRDDAAAPPAPESGPGELAQVATAFNAMVDARRRADGRFRAIVQHASDYVLVLDSEGTVTYAGPAAEKTLGVSVGSSALELVALVHDDDRMRVMSTASAWLRAVSSGDRCEIRLGSTETTLRYVEIAVQNLLNDPAVNGVVLTAHDVTERKHFEEHLAQQARHDPLTGLANRSAVVERLTWLTNRASINRSAVLFVDLDRFKLINDSHGHAVGDEILVALSNQLRGAVRPGDLVGRFGGDEFVVVAPNVETETQAEHLAQRVQAALAAPITVGGRELFVSGSIGIALAGRDDKPDTLLRNADTAMYRAKESGRNCFALFDDAMRAAAVQRLEIENGLHRALDRDELVVFYQPVVALGDGSPRGVEALVRWRHPEHGLVSPAEFIPVAEETGLIVPIGTWVMREAATWAATTAQRIGMPIRVSVNVSPRQLTQPDFLETVDDVLMTTGLAPSLLCLEVTESLLVDDAEIAAATFRSLRERGLRVAIDDFGTGYSSMSYLQQFAVDELKLDRSFISSLGTDETTATIVGSLVGMAHAIGLEVTAEGVEDDDQLAFLQAVGCERAQGFFFARPRHGHDVELLLAESAMWGGDYVGEPV